MWSPASLPPVRFIKDHLLMYNPPVSQSVSHSSLKPSTIINSLTTTINSSFSPTHPRTFLFSPTNTQFKSAINRHFSDTISKIIDRKNQNDKIIFGNPSKSQRNLRLKTKTPTQAHVPSLGVRRGCTFGSLNFHRLLWAVVVLLLLLLYQPFPLGALLIDKTECGLYVSSGVLRAK